MLSWFPKIFRAMSSIMSFLFREMTKAAVNRFLQETCSRKFSKITMETSFSKSHFNKVPGLQSATLLSEKKLGCRCSLVNSAKFSRTPFYVTPGGDGF